MLPATWLHTLRSSYPPFVLVPFPPSACFLSSHPNLSENHLLPANLENGPRLPSTSGRARPRPPVLSLSTSIRVPSSLHILLQHGFQNSQYVTLSRLLFTTAAWNGKVPYVITENGRVLLTRAQRQVLSELFCGHSSWLHRGSLVHSK